ncbi:hypothetical protein CL619_03130 [archaeon]|nr:hypothetical protein [archaeon]
MFLLHMAISDVPSDRLPEMMQILLGDLVETIQPVLEWLSWLLGGIFGLYLLYFLIRLYFDRRRTALLKEVHEDVEFLKDHSLTGDELSKLRTILNTHPIITRKKKRKTSAKKKKKNVKKRKKK